MLIGDLKQIKGMTGEAIELLSAVGVESLPSLAQSDPLSLYDEMFRANRHLSLTEEIPTKRKITGWIREAQGSNERTDSRSQVAPAQRSVEEISIILPLAVAVKKEQIIKNKIAVSDVPMMEDFLEDLGELGESGDLVSQAPSATPRRKQKLKRKRKRRDPSKAQEKSEPASGTSKRGERGERGHLESRAERVSSGEGQASSQKIPTSKSNPLAQGEENRVTKESRPAPIEPLKRNAGFDIRKTASAKLNEGRTPHSRRFVRGVLHPQPGRVKLAAFISFLTFLLFPTILIAAVIVIFREPLQIEPSLWLLAAPGAFFFFACLYLAIARPLKCRICGQPLLSRKACFKHVKAHRLPLLGYIVPTSLHMLFFHWFRCIYCGTAVRLKE